MLNWTKLIVDFEYADIIILPWEGEYNLCALCFWGRELEKDAAQNIQVMYWFVAHLFCSFDNWIWSFIGADVICWCLKQWHYGKAEWLVEKDEATDQKDTTWWFVSSRTLSS